MNGKKIVDAATQIKISVSDENKRRHLHFLFNKESNGKKILEEIIKLRQKWTDGKTFISVNTWEDTLKSPIETFAIYSEDLLKLRKQFQLSQVYDDVLKQAIITGKVTSINRIMHVRLPFFVLEDLPEVDDSTLEKGTYEDAYIVLPEALQEEATEEIAKIRSNIKKASKYKKESQYKPRLPISERASLEKVTEMHKKWYFLHFEKKLSYGDIEKLEKENGNHTGKQAIFDAVKKLRTINNHP